MAPSKRPRRALEEDDDDDEEEVNVQEARSTFSRESQAKRVRVSLDKPQDPPSRPIDRQDDSSSFETDDDQGSEAPASPSQTQYEMMRDNGFRHLENTDMDDQLATQKLMQRNTTQVLNNMVAESGIIESVECINFMCHERLHVELGPLINFIVGENGSGKSAVLTALTLCLGGKASDTNRGGSLKSFVKEGREHGTLIVKIKNAGSDAYKPDVYGQSIIVERHFSKSGSSGFKIKGEQGRVISIKKQEVEEISEWYALQIGNPLTVLSQDNARQFLNAATPAQKYKYFVSGVQLEQLDNDYKMSQDTLDKTLILRDDLDEKISQVKREMEDAQRLAETAQKNQSLREKARHYRNQLVWSQVVEQERELERRNAELITRDERLVDAGRECEELSRALVELEEKVARTVEAREALDGDRHTLDDKVSDAESLYNEAKRKQTELQREERDAFARLKTLRGEIQANEARIQEEEKRLGESTGSARAQKDAELVEVSARVKDIETRLSEARASRPTFDVKIRDASKALERVQDFRSKKHQEISVAENGVRELQNNTGSSVHDGYDRDLIRLANAVKEDEGFENKPLGPLGVHVRLRKPEWSEVIEKTLGDGLNAFVVKSKSDQSRLSNLIRRLGLHRQPPIFIAYGGRIDTSSQEPDAEFDTILRVLEFDNELIRSQVIINYQIEKIILVKERIEAERIMIDNDGPPRNVSACICFHDGRGKRGHGLRITNRSGTISTGPVVPRKQRPRMRSDSRRQLEVQEENLRLLKLEMKDLMVEEHQAKTLIERQQAELQRHQASTKELEVTLRRTRADAEQISTDLDAFEGADGRLVALREEREAKIAEEENLGLQYGNMKLEKRDLSTKAEQAKRKLDAEKDERRDYQARITKADEKVKAYESMRKIAVAQKNDAFESVDIQKAERRRWEGKRDHQVEEVADFIRQAQEVAPDRVHIPDNETYESIEKKYQKLGEQLAQREARLGATDQQIYDRAAEATARYEDVMKKTRDVDETISSLKQAIEHRLHLWRQFQRQISARIRIQFNYLLSERGFRGKIDLDHRARKVNIQIEPDQTKRSSAGRNTKTLSGGEKSFSSICMLLSVWEAIGSPIRCLDEFDVFMDNVNRAISTNMLVDAARRSVSRQYILITPNAIEGRARLDKDVKIIRLTDPRQRTLI